MFESVLREYLNRECRRPSDFSYSSSRQIPLVGVANFECKAKRSFQLASSSEQINPPFDCAFSPTNPDLLLIVKEDGVSHIYDTSKFGSESLLKSYTTHENAIFCVEWLNFNNRFLTGSGDQSVRLSDAETGCVVASFLSHTMTVKSLALGLDSDDVFVSGSRDGTIRLWDARVKNIAGNGCVFTLSGCHTLPSFRQSRRHRASDRSTATEPCTVTNVQFVSKYNVASTGSTDGAIKTWDIRKFRSTCKSAPQPIITLPYVGVSQKLCGFADLILDSSKTKLLASCTDHVIYEYDISSVSTRPTTLYAGHELGSFYIKMSLSPDDSWLVCGSSDSRALIYSVGKRSQMPVVLTGHNGEVSVPCWSRHDPTRLATLSDTAELFVWEMVPSREYTMPNRGELVGMSYASKKLTIREEDQVRRLVPPSPQKSPTVVSTTMSHDLDLLVRPADGSSSLSPTLTSNQYVRETNIFEFMKDLPCARATAAKSPSRLSVPSLVEPRPIQYLPFVSGSRIVHRFELYTHSSSRSIQGTREDDDSDQENSSKNVSEASTEAVSHLRLKQLRLTNLRDKSSSPFSDLTNSPHKGRRATITTKRRRIEQDTDGEWFSEVGGLLSQSSDRVGPFEFVSGTNESPRRRRRTVAPTTPIRTTSTSTTRRRRSTLRPVATGRNSIRNYFKPTDDA